MKFEGEGRALLRTVGEQAAGGFSPDKVLVHVNMPTLTRYEAKRRKRKKRKPSFFPIRESVTTLNVSLLSTLLCLLVL